MKPEITRVGEKVKAFRKDYPPDRAAILTSFIEDEVGGVPRVVGHCEVIIDGTVVAVADGTRALRAPKPGAQGHQDTRDPDRAMTQAVGRALGLLGYADGESLEGDTDEPDESGVTHTPRRNPAGGFPAAEAKKRLLHALNGDKAAAIEAWGDRGHNSIEHSELDFLIASALEKHGEPFE